MPTSQEKFPPFSRNDSPSREEIGVGRRLRRLPTPIKKSSFRLKGGIYSLKHSMPSFLILLSIHRNSLINDLGLITHPKQPTETKSPA